MASLDPISFDLPSLSRPSRDELLTVGPEVRTLSTQAPLWRIHMTASQHPQAWNRLRTWGPLASARWDAHPMPQGEHPSAGVAYLAFDVVTCLAEVFQSTRFVDVHTGTPYVTLFSLTRPVRLLDVTGDWLMRAGARASVAMGKKSRTRQWARAIRDAWPDLDGVYSRSAVAGAHECVTLWGGSEDAFPRSPLLSTPLSSPAVVTSIKIAAESMRYSSNC